MLTVLAMTARIGYSQTCLDSTDTRTAIKAIYTLQSCETDKYLCDSDNAILRSENVIWQAKYSGMERTKDSMAFELNNCTVDFKKAVISDQK